MRLRKKKWHKKIRFFRGNAFFQKKFGCFFFFSEKYWDFFLAWKRFPTGFDYWNQFWLIRVLIYIFFFFVFVMFSWNKNQKSTIWRPSHHQMCTRKKIKTKIRFFGWFLFSEKNLDFFFLKKIEILFLVWEFFLP